MRWCYWLLWVMVVGCATGTQQQWENPSSACGPQYNLKNRSALVGPYVCYSNMYYGYFASYFPLDFWPTANCQFCSCCE